MRDSAVPSRAAPLRRIAILGLVFVAAILSCGKDVTGPLGAAMNVSLINSFTPTSGQTVVCRLPSAV